MLTAYSPDHRRRDAQTELSDGCLVAPFECPERAEQVLARVRESGLGPVVPPRAFGLDPVRRIHDPAFLDFLEQVWAEWTASGAEGEAIPSIWPPRGTDARATGTVTARLGTYALGADTSITDGTWEAACAAADVALTGAAAVAAGDRAAFALCRPPGHHAARDLYGGYCFLNNAAVAAQTFLDGGAGRAAVLDVDFHHGNGTQSIFYDRAEVLFLSLHGDPDLAFPYYWGRTDETGVGRGDGATGNYPLPPGTTYGTWGEALEAACRRIADFAPDALVVSLGVDGYKDDPLSFFALETEDYLRCGARIGKLGLPTLFALEGGYDLETIGDNTVNVLLGFEGA